MIQRLTFPRVFLEEHPWKGKTLRIRALGGRDKILVSEGKEELEMVFSQNQEKFLYICFPI